MSKTTAVQQHVLSAKDRCDRCSARAYVRAKLSSGGELLFCAHHARKYSQALREAEAIIDDQSHLLTNNEA